MESLIPKNFAVLNFKAAVSEWLFLFSKVIASTCCVWLESGRAGQLHVVQGKEQELWTHRIELSCAKVVMAYDNRATPMQKSSQGRKIVSSTHQEFSPILFQ